VKIEIDLDDILGDENGAETLQESIRRQVIDSVTATIKKGVGQQIDAAVSSAISTNINDFLKQQMPSLLANIMDTQYEPVGRYGEKAQPTSFRQELVKVVIENMQYKRANYESDKNVFTKTVDAVIAENVASFKTDFNKKVDAEFTAAAMQYAQEALKKKLGIA